MNKKLIISLLILPFLILVGVYFIDFNRIDTSHILEPKGKQTGKDYMLSSLNVTAISQDNRKLIWIGTSAGLNVFNGHDYLQFFHDTKDTTALPDDYINVIHRDHQGNMWVGTQNGLARYEGGSRYKQALTNIIDMGKEKVCLVGNHEIISANITSGKLSVIDNARILPQLSVGTRQGDAIYVSSKAPYIIRCKFRNFP